MKITRRQLRKLISESFIGAPDGTVYTPQTKKVHNRYYSSYPNRPLMDVPAVYGEDDTQVATPRLYSFLTRNRDEIHNFHEKGPKVYKAIMDPKEDPETKMQFLTLLQSYGIITDKELEDIQLDLDLLTSPDFAEFRRLGAERLKKMAAEPFGENEGVEKANLYKNPHYVEWAKKQIDKAVDGGFEYFKDAIEEQFFYHMHDHKRQKLSNFDYNPDEGIYPENFASLYIYEIGGLLGAYKGFRSTEDAAYYNTALDDYTNNKSHDMIMVAIDALVDAGILEELDDGAVRMPMKTYQIILNNQQGRKEDFYKEQGTRSPFLDDPYVSNPNLPVITKEGKVKITRRQLKRLIAEALDEGSRIIVDPEGEATVASDAFRTGTAKDAQTKHPKLMTLRQSGLTGQRQARQLAVDLEMQPELTAGEETAVEMGKLKAMMPDLKFHNELPGTKSIELSQYLKSECQKRGFTCSVQDTRHKKPNEPHITVHIEGDHPLRYEDINAVVYINDSWLTGIEIEMRSYHTDAPAGLPREERRFLKGRNTAPYLAGKYGENGLEKLANLVIDSVSY